MDSCIQGGSTAVVGGVDEKAKENLMENLKNGKWEI